MSSGLSLGRILGVRVRVHWSALLIAVILAAQMSAELGTAISLAAVLLFMASILAHEFGHALCARRFGVGTDSIHLWALGGVARLDTEAETPKAEAWIAAGGPLVSFALGIGLVGIGWLAVPDQHLEWRSAFVWLGALNLLLAAFNILPGSPLDGGRLVRAARWARHGNRYQATRDAATAGEWLSIAMALVGMYLIVTLGTGYLLLITALFLWASARAEFASSFTAERLDGYTVGDITWYGVAEADSEMDADTMLWQRQRLGMAGGVSVTDVDGRPIGMVLEDDLWAVPAEQRPWVLLPQLLIPFEQTTRAQVSEPLGTVVKRLHLRRPLITVWDDDRLIGVVPPKRLREKLIASPSA